MEGISTLNIQRKKDRLNWIKQKYIDILLAAYDITSHEKKATREPNKRIKELLLEEAKDRFFERLTWNSKEQVFEYTGYPERLVVAHNPWDLGWVQQFIILMFDRSVKLRRCRYQQCNKFFIQPGGKEKKYCKKK